MFTKLRTVIYHVTDLPRARDWYAALIGKPPYFDQPFYVGFDVQGFELGLDPDMTDVAAGNHTVAYWNVENIHAALQDALDKGASLVSPINNVGGSIEVAIVADPFGNHIGLITGE